MIPAIIAAVAAVVGVAVNAIQQNKQIKTQKEENRLVFEENKELAKIQNEYNISQWNAENEYKSPVNQMKLYEQAGLNPDLIYGNGLSSMTSASSPALSAGTPLSPVDYNLGGSRRLLGDSIQSGLNSAMQQAQIANLREDTKGKNIDNEFKPEVYRADIELALANAGVAKEQRQKIANESVKVVAETEHVFTSIDSLRKTMWFQDESIALQKIQTALNEREINQNILESASRIGLNKAQTNEINKLMSAKLNLLVRQGDLTLAQTRETLSREVLNILQQEKVINETDKIALENMILKPEALKAKELTDVYKTSIAGVSGADLANVLSFMYEYMNNVSNALGNIMPVLTK